MLQPFDTYIEFKAVAPSVLDPSRPSMGVTAPGATVRCEVLSVGVPSATSLAEFDAEAAGKWPLRKGDKFWCEPSAIKVSYAATIPGGQNVPRYYVNRSFIIAVEPL